MTKTSEILSELVKNPKANARGILPPAKASKSRYERRKVRGYLRVTNWIDDADM